MLGMNNKGQFVEIEDFDPLTGARSLHSINTGSPLTDVVLSSEHNLAKQEQAQAYAEGLEYTQKEQNALKRKKEIARKKKELDEYNYKVMQYQKVAQMNENLKQKRDNLSVEAAIIDFQKNPIDPSILMDSGFKTVRPRGRAHDAPITDYEKVLQAQPVGVTPVVIDHNPLSGIDFAQGTIVNRDQVADHLGRMNGIRDVEDEFSMRDSVEFKNDYTKPMGELNWDQLWNTAQESLQAEAEKYVESQIQRTINPTSTPSTSSTSTPAVRPTGPMYIPTTTISAQNQKLIMYGALGLLGVAVVGMLIRRR